MQFKEIDNYVFDYLLQCTRTAIYWRFRDLPRDTELENKIIELGKKEAAFLVAYQGEFLYSEPSSKLWTYLELPDSRILNIRLYHLNSQDDVPIERAAEYPSIPFPYPSQFRYGQNEFLASFSSNGELATHGVYGRSLGNKKIFLPFAKYGKYGKYGKSALLPFWPSSVKPSFFNVQYLHDASAVILCDDIVLAWQRQQELVAARVADIAWLSWFGKMEEYPWKDLKQKAVYFFSEPHSGLSPKSMLETAKKVQNLLQEDITLIVSSPSTIAPMYSPLFGNTIPLLMNISELEHIHEQAADMAPSKRNFFRKKLAPQVKPAPAYLLPPFLRLGSRTFVYGTRHSGARAWVLALCHAFLTGKAVLPHAATPIPGVVLYFHQDQDQDSISDVLTILKRKENFDYRESHSEVPLTLQGISSPMFIRYPLRIAALNPQSQSDATGFIETLNESASALQTELPKLMVLDSILPPLVNFPHELRTLLDALEKTGWTLLIFDSARPVTWKKILDCDEHITIEHIPTPVGWDVACCLQSCARQKTVYQLNLTDPKRVLLCGSPTVLKPQGLLRDRDELKADIKDLCAKGMKGKGIAEKLKISESFVKKLKGEMGLSRKRRFPLKFL